MPRRQARGPTARCRRGEIGLTYRATSSDLRVRPRTTRYVKRLRMQRPFTLRLRAAIIPCLTPVDPRQEQRRINAVSILQRDLQQRVEKRFREIMRLQSQVCELRML